ncbi:FAD-dependent monooxygenase [Streptomyces hygroscopicus]|uniref:FAD-dependent monooxygenase n=1 Tax=Streptomyces hygroscopicus TaxID=1912 RepID=UPI00369BFFF7
MDTDVIVVGAGATGLMVAAELALAGVRPVVLETLGARSTQSRALNLHPRTSEILQARGLLVDLLEHQIVLGTPAHSFFGALPVPLDCHPWRTRHPYQIGVLQTRVEERLERRLAELGVTVSRGHEVTAVEQDPDGVTATVRTAGGERRLRARYLVGCDGGRSRVRKALAVDFPGTDGSRLFVAADVVLARPPERWHAELDPERRRHLRLLPGNSMAGVVPVPGGRLMFSLRALEDGVHRLSFSGPAVQRIPREEPVAEAEILEAIRTACGLDSELKEVRWASRFSDACRQVERYRHGRVLLAGDAAHIIVPLGGQGLNLGLQDAFNLGWKLAAEVSGWAPPGLLDTYHTERHPAAAVLLREARAQFSLLDGGPELTPLREVLIELLGLPETNRHLAGVVSGLGLRHPVPDGAHPLVGRRLPDLDLRTADGPLPVHRLLRGGRGVFLDLSGAPADEAVVGAWAHRVDIRAATAAEDIGARQVLVRPDGHVCWADDRERLADALGRWFGAPR